MPHPVPGLSFRLELRGDGGRCGEEAGNDAELEQSDESEVTWLERGLQPAEGLKYEVDGVYALTRPTEQWGGWFNINVNQSSRETEGEQEEIPLLLDWQEEDSTSDVEEEEDEETEGQEKERGRGSEKNKTVGDRGEVGEQGEFWKKRPDAKFSANTDLPKVGSMDAI